MRTAATKDGRTVVGIAGKHAVLLAFKWPQKEFKGLLGFAIQRKQGNRESIWLPTVINFPDVEITKGQLHSSSEVPVQSMIWNDFGLSENKTRNGLPAGTKFIYTVIPIRGTAAAQIRMIEESVNIELSTEAEHELGSDLPEVHFNRGLSDSQEYERLFGELHNPKHDQLALNWLARDLDTNLLKFVDRAVQNKTLLVDMAAYHLDYKPLINAICQIGNRARVSLDWGPEEKHAQKPGPNGPAYQRLKEAGVMVHQREHVSISHNKYIVLKSADGSPLGVLTGSTNFTQGGISTQSNQSVIVHNAKLADAYLKDFERVLQNDNVDLRDDNQQGAVIDDTLEVFFSPHASNNRPDLDRLTELAKAAKSSRLFMTFRMTDVALIEAMLDDSATVFGVADRVYRGNDNSGDRLIFDEAHRSYPRVVACNAPLFDEPEEGALYAELKRDMYNPIVHHKIIILDWDKPTCVVVTGSANYSTNSTAHNDENSLIVHGDQRLAEEYLVEFSRLFTHWQLRWLRERGTHDHRPEYLATDSSWTKIWKTDGKPAEFLALVAGTH